MESEWEKQLEEVLAAVREMDRRVCEWENIQLWQLWLRAERIRLDAELKVLEAKDAILDEMSRRLQLINRIQDDMQNWQEGDDFEEEKDGPTLDWLTDCVNVVWDSIEALEEDLKRF